MTVTVLLVLFVTYAFEPSGLIATPPIFKLAIVSGVIVVKRVKVVAFTTVILELLYSVA